MYNDTQATFFSAPGRIVVIGDVHGDVQRFMQCLYAARVFNQKLEWIAEPADTIVVQLGDQIDSASRVSSVAGDEWEQLCDVEMVYLTDRLDAMARLRGGRVLSLLGNHELMNVQGEFSYVSEKSAGKLPLERRGKMFRPGGPLAKVLAKRTLVTQIGRSVFCHAGILPHHLIAADNKLHRLNEVTRAFLNRAPMRQDEVALLNHAVMDMQGVLWTRMYVELAEANREVLASAVSDVLGTLGASRIFVGHNTVPAITGLLDGKLFFMDAGLSRAYATTATQFLQIWNPDTEQERMEVVQISPPENLRDGATAGV
jgi:hypothetical protein